MLDLHAFTYRQISYLPNLCDVTPIFALLCILKLFHRSTQKKNEKKGIIGQKVIGIVIMYGRMNDKGLEIE